ncbi:hypothetical protein [Mycoplasma phocoenae]|uniref:ZIP Zinc transporter n=1 Tax=Mycoplasma phocoenae TaxID=754517 RepID=A0A858U345_9MOLU|nr:hypothetical protein [Mycoplasma phocoenae]QJG66842.1 hypothetical protein HGG69_00660 [Mycoplasma phocoenae]
MLFGISSFNNNLNLTIFVNLLIYLSFLLVIPVLISLVMSFIKPKLKSNSMIWLYSFSMAMFLVLGTMGFLKEGHEVIEQNYSEANHKWTTALIMGCSSLIGLSLLIGWRYLSISKHKGHIHKHHAQHNHSDHIINFSEIDNPKAAWTAIMMLMSHRLVGGITLGMSVYHMTNEGYASLDIGLILTFNLHIIIETITIFYRQVQYGQTKAKATLYNFYTLLTIVPLMFIGAFSAQYIYSIPWLLASMDTIAGVIILFTAIFELVPEVIHIRNEKPKVLYMTFIMFALGIVFTIVLLSFHSH